MQRLAHPKPLHPHIVPGTPRNAWGGVPSRRRYPAAPGTINNPSVGADAYIGPPILHRTPCKKAVIARPVRKLVVAIRNPRPLGPLA